MLHGAQISEHLELSVEKYINDSSNTEIISEKWTSQRNTISAAEQDIGFQKRKYQDWFSEHQEEIDQMINEKREACLAFEGILSVEKKSIRKQQKVSNDDSLKSRIPGARQRQQKSSDLQTNGACVTFMCPRRKTLAPSNQR